LKILLYAVSYCVSHHGDIGHSSAYLGNDMAKALRVGHHVKQWGIATLPLVCLFGHR